MSRRERFGRCLVVVAWMALITYWSDQGSLPIDQPMVATALHGFQHRFAHLVAFGLLALLARWAFESVPRAVILAIVLTSIFGAVDELHQSFVPGRRSAIDDWAFDTLFGGLGIAIWQRLEWLSAIPRSAAPIAASAVFAAVLVFTLHAQVSRAELNQVAARALPAEVAHSAKQLARSTRDLARQALWSASG